MGWESNELNDAISPLHSTHALPIPQATLLSRLGKGTDEIKLRDLLESETVTSDVHSKIICPARGYYPAFVNLTHSHILPDRRLSYSEQRERLSTSQWTIRTEWKHFVSYLNCLAFFDTIPVVRPFRGIRMCARWFFQETFNFQWVYVTWLCCDVMSFKCNRYPPPEIDPLV